MQYIFPPAPQVFVEIADTDMRFPVRRIFCVGRNYEAHAKEMGASVDREAPFYFTKASEHVAPSGGTIVYPPGTSNYHYEMELVVAIGKPGFRIADTGALDHVFGYACGLDMTRRDLQAVAKEKRRPWDLGKDVEQSAVLGDIAPTAKIGHPHRGRIELPTPVPAGLPSPAAREPHDARGLHDARAHDARAHDPREHDARRRARPSLIEVNEA